MDKKTVSSLIGLVSGLGALGVSIYSYFTTKDMAGTIGSTVKDLKGMTHVEVEKAVVDKVVADKTEKIVKEVVRKRAEEAADEVTKYANKEIQSKVSDAVRAASETIEAGIKERYDKELEYINIEDLKEDVKKEARKKIMKRFDGELDGILGDYNKQLQSVGKIYSSIADAFKN